jgi:hypothetical protein
MPFALEDLPPQPAPADAATRLSELLGNDLARFAMTFDGYEHFGDHWPEIYAARREEFDAAGTLPRDVDALRGLLFLAFRSERFTELDDSATITDVDGNVVHAAEPERITDARRDLERFKHALLARMRTLIEERG